MSTRRSHRAAKKHRSNNLRGWLADRIWNAAGCSPQRDRSLGFESLEPRAMLAAAATGVFSGANTVGISPTATSVQTADIDKDGDADIVATSFDGNSIVWYENKQAASAGAWVAHTISTTAMGAEDVCVADIDGDGDMDVLCASAADNRIAWYENDGTPAVGLWTFHSISTTANRAFKVIAADLDKDGDLDVLSASYDNDKIAWYINDGTPATGVWASRTITTAADGATCVYAADMDGDGDLDVVSASFLDDKIAWYENDGTPDVGGWVARTITVTADGANKVVAADIDGDGDMDLVSISTNDNKINWYTNDGTPADGGWTVHQIGSANFLQGLCVADIDGDGDMDVCTASYNDSLVAWFQNDGTPADGQWNGHLILSDTPTLNALSVTTGDIDGDGDLDVISASYGNGTIAWFRNQSGHAAGDYDRDGHVGQGDLDFLKAHIGAVYGPGMAADGNGDGHVDSADYTIVRDNWGVSAPTAGAGGGSGGLTSEPTTTDSSITQPVASEPTAVAPPATSGPLQLISAVAAESLSAGATKITRPTIGARTMDQVFSNWEHQSSADLRALRLRPAPLVVLKGDDSSLSPRSTPKDTGCAAIDMVFDRVKVNLANQTVAERFATSRA